MPMANWELLHITDLHYGDTYSDETKLPVPPAFRQNLKTGLRALIAAFLPRGTSQRAHIPLPDAVLLTGDLTNRGDPGGLDQLSDDWGSFLRVAANDRLVAVVPGNHDVRWRVDTSDPNLFDGKFEYFVKFVRSMSLRTCAIPTGSLATGEIQFRQSQGSPVVVDKDRGLVVVCINSAIRCGELNMDLVAEARKLVEASRPASNSEALLRWIEGRCLHDIAQVTTGQRALLEEALTDARRDVGPGWWNSALKVAVLHHHLVGFPGPVEYKEFESTLDAPQTLTLLARFGVQLVLTGHKHQSYETHQIVRVDGREHHMVVAGGATVLGGVIEAKRGFNQVHVSRSDNGAMTFRFRTVPIELGLDSFVARWKDNDWEKTRTVELPATLVVPGMDAVSLPIDRPGQSLPINSRHVRAHEAARIYSGVQLSEYCFYCKTLAENCDDFLFTLLTIDPTDLVFDLCRGVWPQDVTTFLQSIDDANLHFATFREHKNGVRLVVAHDESRWLEKNRPALPYLQALNGNMRCYVVQRSRLVELGGVLLADHTAVSTRICMYDREALMMTTGQIDINHKESFYSRLVDAERVDRTIFVPLVDFIATVAQGAHS